MFAPAKPTLKARALRALAARELTRAELRAKLLAHLPADAKDGVLDALLDELETKGFLSDQRAANALSNRRAPKLGTQRVVHELRQRGTDAQAVAEVAQALRATELERACAVWQKKFGGSPAGAADRMKQMRFLASRGFDGAIVSQVLRSAGASPSVEVE